MPETTLFCLPFAGGSRYSYKKFDGLFGEAIKAVCLELPGRGARIREPLLTDVHLMADDLFCRMKDSLDRPYAIYGHSMGALLGYLVTRRIVGARCRPPVHLFFSGCGGPAVGKGDPDHLLPDADFIGKMKALAGCPDETWENEALVKLFLPILRADIGAIGKYVYQPAAPLDIPISVCIGTREEVTPAEANAWQRESGLRIEVAEFPGRHFFIFDHAAAVAGLISQRLRTRAAWH